MLVEREAGTVAYGQVWTTDVQIVKTKVPNYIYEFHFKQVGDMRWYAW